MSELCAVPGCPNEAELFHPDRYVGLCREHPDWILAYGIVGTGVLVDGPKEGT